MIWYKTVRGCQRQPLSLSINPIFLRERLHLQGDPNRVRHPLKKQSTGLFFNFPFAKRFEAICGVTPHSVGRCRAATKGTGLLSLPHTPPEALPLDSAKGTQSLWNPIHWYKDFFDRLRGCQRQPLKTTFYTLTAYS